MRRLSLESVAPHEDPAAKYVDLQVRSRDGVVWQNGIVLDIDDSYRDPALPRIWELIKDGVFPDPNWTCGRLRPRRSRERERSWSSRPDMPAAGRPIDRPDNQMDPYAYYPSGPFSLPGDILVPFCWDADSIREPTDPVGSTPGKRRYLPVPGPTGPFT